VEVNRAPYEKLLRVPGIGVTSARRIIRARRETKLDFDGLKKLGVVLKRASYFITCSGKMCCRIQTDNPMVLMGILRDRGLPQGGFQPEMPEQLSLFQPTREDGVKCLTGQL
jgi:predicted DNA-binding helix-hairpin-helix protein